MVEPEPTPQPPLDARPPSEQLARMAIVVLHALPFVAAAALGVLAIWRLQEVLTPIFLSFTIAYVLDPVVDRLEARRIPRGLGILLVMVGLIAALAGFLLFIIPSLVEDIIRVAKDVPRRVGELVTSIEPWLRAQGVEVPHSVDEAMTRFGGQLQDAAPGALGGATQVLQTAGRGTLSFISGLGNVVVVMVITVYLLLDFDLIMKNASTLVPYRYRASVGSVMREVDTTLAQWIRGQLTVMLILAVLYSIGFSVAGIRLAVGIGILAGVLSFIPYFGTAVGLVLAILMSIIDWHGPLPLLGVLITVALVQVADGLFITPRIVGGKVGLGPAWVIIALMTGGHLFGFLGVLLAVPSAAIIKILVQRLVAYYQHTALFTQGASASGVSVPPPAAEQPETPAEAVPPSEPLPYSPLTAQLEAAVRASARGDAPEPAASGAQAPPATGAQAPPASGAQAPPASGAHPSPASGAHPPPASGPQAPPASGPQAPPASGPQAPPATGAHPPPASGPQAPPATGPHPPPLSLSGEGGNPAGPASVIEPETKT